MNYRGYSINQESGLCVARSLDGDDLAIVSRDLNRVTSAVCDLWVALDYVDQIRLGEADLIPISRVIREWVANPTPVIYLDAANARGAC
ncbi:hypothetical protein [Bradyrhizobium sp. 76]|uniref:hypothetical protein n=1 Tax=Bradyrhizobium sp. 76 TaxID=2782680 RepID=UPI001FFAD571|nr:hypothetical protein [Bradyrhizobium sp. 76]MCK1410186.1 hypothetical protein [Bradyrhizobium sp. 76]